MSQTKGFPKDHSHCRGRGSLLLHLHCTDPRICPPPSSSPKGAPSPDTPAPQAPSSSCDKSSRAWTELAAPLKLRVYRRAYNQYRPPPQPKIPFCTQGWFYPSKRLLAAGCGWQESLRVQMLLKNPQVEAQSPAPQPLPWFDARVKAARRGAKCSECHGRSGSNSKSG